MHRFEFWFDNLLWSKWNRVREKDSIQSSHECHRFIGCTFNLNMCSGGVARICYWHASDRGSSPTLNFFFFATFIIFSFIIFIFRHVNYYSWNIALYLRAYYDKIIRLQNNTSVDSWTHAVSIIWLPWICWIMIRSISIKAKIAVSVRSDDKSSAMTAQLQYVPKLALHLEFWIFHWLHHRYISVISEEPFIALWHNLHH